MDENPLLQTIAARRSIRAFTDMPIHDSVLDAIMRAGSWAPSGLNNQPWKFIPVRDPDVLAQLSVHTKYARIIAGAPACIAMFLDTERSYHREKDIQAIGACIQNMLLACSSLGLGAVWLGEILTRHIEVEALLQAPPSCELMAVIALGHPADAGRTPERRDLADLIVRRT